MAEQIIKVWRQGKTQRESRTWTESQWNQLPKGKHGWLIEEEQDEPKLPAFPEFKKLKAKQASSEAAEASNAAAPTPDEEFKRKVLELAAAGKTQAQIGKELGVHYSKVKPILEAQ